MAEDMYDVHKQHGERGRRGRLLSDHGFHRSKYTRKSVYARFDFGNGYCKCGWDNIPAAAIRSYWRHVMQLEGHRLHNTLRQRPWSNTKYEENLASLADVTILPRKARRPARPKRGDRPRHPQVTEPSPTTHPSAPFHPSAPSIQLSHDDYMPAGLPEVPGLDAFEVQLQMALMASLQASLQQQGQTQVQHTTTSSPTSSTCKPNTGHSHGAGASVVGAGSRVAMDDEVMDLGACMDVDTNEYEQHHILAQQARDRAVMWDLGSLVQQAQHRHKGSHNARKKKAGPGRPHAKASKESWEQLPLPHVLHEWEDYDGYLHSLQCDTPGIADGMMVMMDSDDHDTASTSDAPALHAAAAAVLTTRRTSYAQALLKAPERAAEQPATAAAAATAIAATAATAATTTATASVTALQAVSSAVQAPSMVTIAPATAPTTAADTPATADTAAAPAAPAATAANATAPSAAASAATTPAAAAACNMASPLAAATEEGSATHATVASTNRATSAQLLVDMLMAEDEEEEEKEEDRDDNMGLGSNDANTDMPEPGELPDLDSLVLAADAAAAAALAAVVTTWGPSATAGAGEEEAMVDVDMGMSMGMGRLLAAGGEEMMHMGWLEDGAAAAAAAAAEAVDTLPVSHAAAVIAATATDSQPAVDGAATAVATAHASAGLPEVRMSAGAFLRQAAGRALGWVLAGPRTTADASAAAPAVVAAHTRDAPEGQVMEEGEWVLL